MPFTFRDASSVSQNADSFAAAAGHQQKTREVRASAWTLNSWTISVTASTNQVAADTSRTGMLIVVTATATGRVYLRMDGTAPTSTAYFWYLDPGERWEVPLTLTESAVSMLGTTAVGTVLTSLGTAA